MSFHGVILLIFKFSFYYAGSKRQEAKFTVKKHGKAPFALFLDGFPATRTTKKPSQLLVS